MNEVASDRREVLSCLRRVVERPVEGLNDMSLQVIRGSLLLACFSCAAASSLQARQAQGAPPTPKRLDIVESVGCLTENPKGTWVLTDAVDPVVSKNPYTNEQAIKDAAAKPLGTKRFTLIAVTMFNVEALRGHKVVVKGLPITDAAGSRLNVTSMQLAAESCR
jgi:hypothetical protein